MGYVLRGMPKAVKADTYPKPGTTIWGKRNGKTKVACASGAVIVGRYYAGADYWKDKVPFLALQYAIEGRRVTNKVLGYAGEDDKAPIMKRGEALRAMTSQAVGPSLQTPTPEVVAYVRKHLPGIYSTVAAQNEATLRLAEIETLIKNDMGAKLVSDAAAISFRFYESLHTGNHKMDKEIAYYVAETEKFVVNSEKDLSLDLGSILKGLVDVGEKFIKELRTKANPSSESETYLKNLGGLMSQQEGNFAAVGKIVSGMKEEFGLVWGEIKASVLLSAEAQMAYNEIGRALDDIARQMWAGAKPEN